MSGSVPPPRQSRPSRLSVPVTVGDERPSETDNLPARYGKYTLIRKLATGGMAELFLALQKSVAGFEKLVVIKRILPTLNKDQSFIDMFLHEARVAATLSHPNIVQIFDVGQANNSYFIAMEHVHGEDLRSIVRQMRKKSMAEFPLEHALSIILGICSGLAYAHEKRDLEGNPLNIVHRDISPQNVIVTFTGDVKIVDFGIAKSDTQLASETGTGKLKGKIPYMSPEQARGENVDWRSDIFSAGVMLFELTTGRRLFKGQSDYETLKLICEREYPLPSQVAENFPAALEQIVMRALAKERMDRFQSAREMQALLETYVRQDRIPVSNLALAQFMRFLFEDKLASQEEALFEGKQLADTLAQNEPFDFSGSAEASAPHATQGSATAHTLTAGGRDRREKGNGRRTGIAALLALISIAASGYWIVAGTRTNTSPKVAEAAAQTNIGSLAIATDPSGATIWIDGHERAEKTPTTLSQLSVGKPLSLRVTKPGFIGIERTISLTEREPTSAMTLNLERGNFSLDVNARPTIAGTGVLVDGKVYHSLRVDSLTAGEAHKVVVFAPGYTSSQFSITGDIGEAKQLEVQLAKVDSRRERSEKSVPQTVPPPSSANNPAPSPAPVAAPQPAGNGKLNVGARNGWCNVSVDGANRGPTPIAGLQLAAGNHVVVCTPESGKPMSATVNVPTDGTARFSFTLPQ